MRCPCGKAEALDGGLCRWCLRKQPRKPQQAIEPPRAPRKPLEHEKPKPADPGPIVQRIGLRVSESQREKLVRIADSLSTTVVRASLSDAARYAIDRCPEPSKGD